MVTGVGGEIVLSAFFLVKMFVIRLLLFLFGQMALLLYSQKKCL